MQEDSAITGCSQPIPRNSHPINVHLVRKTVATKLPVKLAQQQLYPLKQRMYEKPPAAESTCHTMQRAVLFEPDRVCVPAPVRVIWDHA